jgi:hypothetical protein
MSEFALQVELLARGFKVSKTAKDCLSLSIGQNNFLFEHGWSLRPEGIRFVTLQGWTAKEMFASTHKLLRRFFICEE